MSNPLLYPATFIRDSKEAFLGELAGNSQLIYSVLVLGILAAFAALPFINVPISVQSAGLVRATAEKNELHSLVAGTVARVLGRENQAVQAGQALLVIQSNTVDNQAIYNQQEQQDKLALITDLKRLLSRKGQLRAGGTPLVLRSPLYAQQYAQFSAQLQENLGQQQKARKSLAVDETLFAQKVIAQRELEDKEYAYRQLVDQGHTLAERQFSQWQTDLQSISSAVAQLRLQAKQTAREKELYTIRAPTAGTLQQLTGKYPGSPVQNGELLGIVSPDNKLIVECLVSPAAIGHIRLGQAVTLQIDSYNYHEWGILPASVIQVSNDVQLINQKPVFRILCRPTRPYLSLKNGYRGFLKKGMTLQASFLLTKRSLYQLLYDKATDWLSPIPAGG